jgi:ketosteroid isomerase-like protein
MKMVEPVVEVLEMGDWAVVRGTGISTEIIKGNLQTKTYKWVILSQKQDDETWKMVWDIFNYDAPYENS